MELIKLINLDTKIKKIYNYLVELLKQKGLFDNSLEVQVLNVSCQKKYKLWNVRFLVHLV